MNLKTIYTQDPSQIRNQVFAYMLETRGWKYRAFLRYLRLFKYVAFAPNRGEFLESYYVLMRFLDDIVDGDAPLPEGYSSETEYILEKIKFSRHPTEPNDAVDYLMLHCFAVAEKFGADFREETEDILSSLLFDANRRGKMIIFPKEELMHHFHLLDIRGTIKATLKIFRDDPEKFLLLEPLGVACRYQYDIEDIGTDLAAGYVNISEEECARFAITNDDLKYSDAIKIQRWLRQRALDGMGLLEKHHQNLPKGDFSTLEKWTFRLVYEAPARKIFKKVIAETENI